MNQTNDTNNDTDDFLRQADIESVADFMIIALSMLASKHENSLLPEVMFLMNPQQVIDLIRVFGGSSVYIPSSKEFSKDLTSAVIAYHKHVNRYSYSKIRKLMELDGRTMRYLEYNVDQWEKWLKENDMRIPSVLLEGQNDNHQ